MLIVLLGWAAASQAQLIARVTVQTGAYARQRTPVSLDLSRLPKGPYELFAVDGGRRTKVPCQYEPGIVPRLWWQLGEKVPAGVVRTYELHAVPQKGGAADAVQRNNASPVPSAAAVSDGQNSPSPMPAAVTLKDEQGALTIRNHDHPVLQYNYATVYPPAGVDTVFRRSGFIHPAWSPAGKVLTGIHPKDHYHHFGIWNPWTDTEFEGKTVDFWNIAKKTGTVRFVHFISRTQGAVWGGFKTLQAHVVLGATEKDALDEVWDIRAYNGKGMQVWDFVSVLSCGTTSPITLKHYRYGGGFGFRGHPDWNNKNSAVLTSAGKTRRNADSTYMRWFKVAGTSGEGKAGMLVLVAPDNFNFPQPIRVWPEKDLGGQVFINISPTKDRPWTLSYGNEYTQKYRVVTFDGDISAEEAEALWNDYAHPPEVTVSAE
ncbi:DUF6807 domain-containing protein [Chitinophaga cymbidii]|nr:PmoA family protein [Chitinophaga cymbidii]